MAFHTAPFLNVTTPYLSLRLAVIYVDYVQIQYSTNMQHYVTTPNLIKSAGIYRESVNANHQLHVIYRNLSRVLNESPRQLDVFVCVL